MPILFRELKFLACKKVFQFNSFISQLQHQKYQYDREKEVSKFIWVIQVSQKMSVYDMQVLLTNGPFFLDNLYNSTYEFEWVTIS